MESLLRQKKTEIIQKWFAKINANLPPETIRFLSSERDMFSNPVGATLRDALPHIFDFLLDETLTTEVAEQLERVLRIRVAQSMPPSQAVAFVFFLKDVVGDVCCQGASGSNASMKGLEKRFDHLAILAFERYVYVRDRVWEVRLHEVKRRVSTIMRMSRLTDADVDPGMGPPDASS